MAGTKRLWEDEQEWRVLLDERGKQNNAAMERFGDFVDGVLLKSWIDQGWYNEQMPWINDQELMSADWEYDQLHGEDIWDAKFRDIQ
jgi:hypothetical protein